MPETGESRLDLLEKEYPSPLIDLRGLGCREAARKLHDLTRGSITHQDEILTVQQATGINITNYKL